MIFRYFVTYISNTIKIQLKENDCFLKKVFWVCENEIFILIGGMTK